MLEEEKPIWNRSCSIVSWDLFFFFLGLTMPEGGGPGWWWAGARSIKTSSSYTHFQRKEQSVLFLQTDTLARVNVTCWTICGPPIPCSLGHPSWDALQAQQHCAGGQESVNLTSGFQTEVSLTQSGGPQELPPYRHLHLAINFKFLLGSLLFPKASVMAKDLGLRISTHIVSQCSSSVDG